MRLKILGSYVTKVVPCLVPIVPISLVGSAPERKLPLATWDERKSSSKIS